MIRRLLIALAAVALSMTAFVAATTAAPPEMFVTPVNSHEETAPATDQSHAVGSAVFQLNDDGTELSYRLIASNIENVVQAHIHCCAAPGATAGIVVWLAPSTTPGVLIPAGSGRTDGVLATGTITEADLVGIFAEVTMDDFVAALRAGGAYVNVHTNDGVAPPNTGPGDFPGGEIRGQID
jgi:hypothetical protein